MAGSKIPRHIDTPSFLFMPIAAYRRFAVGLAVKYEILYVAEDILKRHSLILIVRLTRNICLYLY